MTAPQQGNTTQIDMGRVVQRATGALADIAVAPLAAELGAAREVIDMLQQRIAELERALEEKDAELARAHQAVEGLQQRADTSEV